jgi:hypothetical protein
MSGYAVSVSAEKRNPAAGSQRLVPRQHCFCTNENRTHHRRGQRNAREPPGAIVQRSR